MPLMGGRLKTKILPSGTLVEKCMARPMMASTDWSFSLRRSQSLREIKKVAASDLVAPVMMS